MDLVQKYIVKHQGHMLEVFNAMGKQHKIQATKVFNYIQNSFDQQQFRFQMNGNDFFAEDQNSTAMEKLLQSYYRLHQADQSKKFYLYRIQFSFQQISQILKFWLQRQPNLTVTYLESTGQENIARGTIKLSKDAQLIGKQNAKNKTGNENIQQTQENNQFDLDDDKIPDLIAVCEQNIKQHQQQIKNCDSDETKLQLKKKIQEIKLKIKVLEQQIKTNKNIKLNKRKSTLDQKIMSPMLEEQKKTNDSPRSSKKKINLNYKAIFQFYAKQIHLTGVKATFERIQHESQSINYQKLVHFLRQYSLMPESGSDKKKLHALYIKNCQNTRDLNFDGFLNVLDGLTDILFKQKSKQEGSQMLKEKIVQKNTKNNKILSHPFHSLQKQDFRINSLQINYSFKLKPQDGKFANQVNESIQKRRKDKQQAKTERFKSKEQKNIMYLKKLQSIDPFNPLLAKNSKLLQAKVQPIEPIASLQNMEQYRDHSFNFESHFGISLQGNEHSQTQSKSSPSKRYSSSKNYDNQGYKRGQQTLKKVEKMQKDEAEKMKNLMSGIIQRTNAKMQKLGISPDKREKSVKFS